MLSVGPGHRPQSVGGPVIFRLAQSTVETMGTHDKDSTSVSVAGSLEKLRKYSYL